MCNTRIAWWCVWQGTLIVYLPPTDSFSTNQQIHNIMEDVLLNKLGMQIRRPTHHQFLFPWTSSSRCTWKKHPSRVYGLWFSKTLRSLQQQKSARLLVSTWTSPVTRKKSRQTDDWMNDMAQLTFKIWLHLLPPSSSSREPLGGTQIGLCFPHSHLENDNLQTQQTQPHKGLNPKPNSFLAHEEQM